MLSEFRRVWGAQECAIHGQYLQALPGIALIALATPLVTRLTKQPLNRIGTQSFTRLGDTASGQQVVRGQPLGTDIQASCDLMHRLVTEQGHAKHQPEHLIAGQTPPPYGGLGGQVQSGCHPLDRDVLGEGAQIREVEQFT